LRHLGGEGIELLMMLAPLANREVKMTYNHGEME